MRVALAALLLLHGLAHLVGFLTPWGLVPQPATGAAPPATNVLFGGRVTLGDLAWRGLSVLWLAVALGFVAVAYGLWRQAAWSWGALIAVSMISLALTLVWWPTARIGTAINVALLAGLLAIGYLNYRRDLSRARGSVLSGSTILRTAAGPIEYATLGEGTPILVLHGTAGGWDQGLYSAQEMASHGFRLVAPSRFGYLRTPMPAGASPAMEADTWATFLDSLGIRRVAVMSWSAGAAPAFQFALRHPDRVSKLVFFVPGGGGVFAASSPGPPPWVMNLVLRWDFPMWAAQRLSPKTMLKLVAVPASLVPSLGPQDRATLEDCIERILPVSARRRGMMYDARNQSGAEGVYPIEKISAPTMLVSAKDDLYRTLPVARRAAHFIRGARLLEFETGGHLLLGRGQEIWPQVAAFLQASAATLSQTPDRSADVSAATPFAHR